MATPVAHNTKHVAGPATALKADSLDGSATTNWRFKTAEHYFILALAIHILFYVINGDVVYAKDVLEYIGLF